MTQDRSTLAELDAKLTAARTARDIIERYRYPHLLTNTEWEDLQTSVAKAIAQTFAGDSPSPQQPTQELSELQTRVADRLASWLRPGISAEYVAQAVVNVMRKPTAKR